MRIIYYVEEKEISKLDSNNTFEYVSSDLINVRSYKIIENELKNIDYVRIDKQYPIEEELREHLEWRKLVKLCEEIKFVKL